MKIISLSERARHLRRAVATEPHFAPCSITIAWRVFCLLRPELYKIPVNTRKFG
jgi:hypothetical protein